MVTADEEISLAYLLDPAFQLVNSAGKPLTNGWIEVYYHGTRTKYYCYSDWNGALHPFQIPLDSLGSNIVLASPDYAYDVYVYNAFGSLVMSRYNVNPGQGGGGEPSSDLPEHWIGHDGAEINIASDAVNVCLPMPSSGNFEYEGTFLDHSDETNLYLKTGIYAIEAVIQFNQATWDLHNSLDNLKITTGDGDTGYYWQEDLTGPEANSNIHERKVTFIRKVTGEDPYPFFISPSLPVQLNNVKIAKLSIVKLGSGAGGGEAYKYLPGDFITIENGVISVTGVQPASGMSEYVTNDTFNTEVTNIYNDISNVTGDVENLTTVVTGDVQNVSAAIDAVSAAIPDAQVQSDWTELDTDSKAYIQHKPQTTELTAGQNIAITEVDGQLVISSTGGGGGSGDISRAEVAAATGVLEGEIQSVSADVQTVSGAVDAVSAAIPEYTGASGITVDNVNDVISMNVEAGSGITLQESQGKITITNTESGNSLPIVAGDGIILEYTNNQLTIHTDETVLWEGIPSSAAADIPLSENPANFEYIDVYARWTYNSSQHINCYVRIFGNETNFSLSGDGTYNNTSTTDYATYKVVGDYDLSSTKISVLRAFRVTSAGTAGNNSDTLKILKVIGINRVA